MRRLVAALALTAVLLGCAIADNAVDRTRMEVSGQQLLVAGEITSRTPSSFERLLADNPQLREVVLTQMSGALDDGAVIRMGHLLRDRGLDTRLTARSEIYSGAVTLFLAGNRRHVAPGAVIGVHAWADGFGEATDYPPGAAEHAGNAAYVAEMLGSDAFYWFTLGAAPSDGIHVMTRAEIARYGLVTR